MFLLIRHHSVAIGVFMLSRSVGIRGREVGIFIVGGGLFLAFIQYLFFKLMPSFSWVNNPIHTVVESFGGFTALLVAAILLTHEARRREISHYLWLCCTLTVMGTLDVLNSAVQPADSFAWFKTISLVVGGSFACLVWLPRRRLRDDFWVWVIAAAVLLGTLGFGIAVLYSPVLWNFLIPSQHGFWARALTRFSGLLFLMGTGFFVLRYRRLKETEDLLFAVLCLLCAASGSLSHSVAVWDGAWWGWHLLDLGADLSALLFLFVTQKRAHAELMAQGESLRKLNETLEEKVAERSKALEERANRLTESETELSHKTQLLELIMANMAEGVAVVGLDHKLMLFNAAAEQICGRPLFEGAPTAWSEYYGLFLPDGKTLVPTEELPLSRASQGETVLDMELLVRNEIHPEGRYIRVDAKPIDDGKGCRIGAVAVFRDITQSKKVTSDLRNSNERFETLARVTNDVVWDWNLETGEVWHNDGFYRLIGMEPGKRVADLNHWKDQIHPDDRDRVWNSFCGVLDSGKLEWQEEYRFGQLTGPRDILDRGHVILDANGRPVRMVGVMIDISRLKEVENRLRHQAGELARSNKDLEQFAYVASHDLKEPLRMVTSFVQMLKRKYQGRLDVEADDYIRYAVEGALRMHSLIDDLLTYSHVDRKTDSFEVTGVGEVLERVLQTLGDPIRESGAEVTVGDLPVVFADPIQLGQLLQNLIGNAIKYRKPGEPLRIHISAERCENAWKFVVKDNGIGIAAEFSDRIFKLFQRLHTKEEYPGTGIGLAICKRISERHGGRIWVESVLGEGSTFYFLIPERDLLPSLRSAVSS